MIDAISESAQQLQVVFESSVCQEFIDRVV